MIDPVGLRLACLARTCETVQPVADKLTLDVEVVGVQENGARAKIMRSLSQEGIRSEKSNCRLIRYVLRQDVIRHSFFRVAV